MAGLPDILSAYREGLASERQFRTSEMQMALSQLQYESEREFREEGRRREDAFRGLTLADKTVKESVAEDASSIYSLMSSLDFIKRDGDGKIEKLKLSKATSSGFTAKEANDIYSMVFMYESELPQLQQQAQNAATNIGRLVSAHKDSWVETGDQSDYLKALSNKGILYAGEKVNGEIEYDETKFDLSYEPFVNISKATDVLANISDELGEMARGDYDIQRSIGMDRKFAKEQSYDDVVSRMANLVQDNLSNLNMGDMIDTKRELESQRLLNTQGFNTGTSTEDINKQISDMSHLIRKQELDKIRSFGKPGEEQVLESLDNLGLERNEQNIKTMTVRLTSLTPEEAMVGF